MKQNKIFIKMGAALTVAVALIITVAIVKAEDIPTPMRQDPSKASSVPVDDLQETYPIMRPDHDTLMKWIETYNNAPKAKIKKDPLRFGLPAPQGSRSLLSHLQYTPSQRNQGSCGDCWAWAGTGVMAIDLSVNKGIKDRLSVQYINSCFYGDWACCGGFLTYLASFYTSRPQAIPWSNTNANFADATRTCGSGSSLVTCPSISSSPNYPISSITATSIPTQGYAQATAISNIKNILNQNKAVWFAYYLPNTTAWNAFYNFWNNQGETALWNPDTYCGQTYDPDNGAGGHAVLCVGYNDDDADPDNHYWIIVNSWGTASGGRPNGIFRMKMNINYSCTFVYGTGSIYALTWQTLDIEWANTRQILWNQPATSNAYADQDFETVNDTYDVWIADDFTNTSNWTIDTIFVPGETWNAGCNLSCATAPHFMIYNDNSGEPDGYPDGGDGGGGNPPVWSTSVSPVDSQITLGTSEYGYQANVTLKLNTPVKLAPGTYWLVFYPEMSYTGCCQYGRMPASSTNGYDAQVINPGAEFGYPTSWTSVQDPSAWALTEQDFAFRLEGLTGNSLSAILNLLLL